ncbi:MAG TPA: hypothetical protein VK826_17755 [Bacteroidia bacterium]|nr:hypothetical protein [Bacteroidia bacterium]
MKLKVFSLVVIAVVSFGFVQTSSIDLAGTAWVYIDEEWTYEIVFDESGRLLTTHPNESTPNNDFWKQKAGTVNFSYNDGYSRYEGTIYGGDSIIGTARNKMDSWKFKMYRFNADSIPPRLQ